MSTPLRSIRNIIKEGPRSVFRQLLGIGDIKHGKFVGQDRYGNKFYENREELPLRHKWVEYKDYDYDASHVEPGWRNWLHHANDLPPTEEPVLKHVPRPWEKQEHVPNVTFLRSAYKPYSTTKPKVTEWEAVAKPRH